MHRQSSINVLNVDMRKRKYWLAPPPLVTYTLLLALLPTWVVCQSEDYFCGLDWVHAANACPKSCPTGNDAECTDELGEEYACFFFTGCYERYQSGEFGPLETDEPEEIEEGGGQEEQQVIEATLPPNANQYCASTWLQAMINCGGVDEEKACPNGVRDCDENEMCQTDTYCDQPLKELESEVQFTLKGPENTLEKVEEQTILLNVTGEYLRGTLETLEISFTSMEILEQEMVTGEVKVNVMIKAATRGAFKKLDSIAENTINLQGQDVVKELKRKGNSEQEYYFTKVSEISVLSTEQLTELPTKSPAGAPTVKPSKEPTKSPTPFPTISGTDWPSEMPSEMPSRPFLTSLTTATRRELTKATSTSYGYVFNVRTKAEVGAVLVKGMDFYTDKFGSVNYELWTRPGTFIGYRGRYAGWELIATGSIKGKGAGELTSIPEEDFTEVSINGGGSNQGTRAFYITLNSKDLVYQAPDQGGSLASKADVNVHDETDEIEIYDGEAILAYPFPPQSQSYMYRAPRKFVGTIYYDRLPCRPLSAFGIIRELPCPKGVVPTASPTIFATKEPSIEPTTAAPTLTPVSDEPTNKVTQSPAAAPQAPSKGIPSSPSSSSFGQPAPSSSGFGQGGSSPSSSSFGQGGPSPSSSSFGQGGTSPSSSGFGQGGPSPSSSSFGEGESSGSSGFADSTPNPSANATETVSPAASPSPSGGAPAAPVVAPMRVAIAMTLINTKERSMNDEEVEAFTKFLLQFMNRHGAPDLSIADISIVSQQKAYYDVSTVKGKGNETDSYVSVKVARSLTSQSTSRLRNGSQRRLKTLPAIEFQIDLDVSSSSVPKSQFAARSLEVITKNKIEFIELIRETGKDLPYFENVNDVLMSYSVPETTASLTPEESSESGGSNIAVIAGAIAAALLALGGGGFVYHKKRKRAKVSSKSKKVAKRSKVKKVPSMNNTEQNDTSESSHDVESPDEDSSRDVSKKRDKRRKESREVGTKSGVSESIEDNEDVATLESGGSDDERPSNDTRPGNPKRRTSLSRSTGMKRLVESGGHDEKPSGVNGRTGLSRSDSMIRVSRSDKSRLCKSMIDTRFEQALLEDNAMDEVDESIQGSLNSSHSGNEKNGARRLSRSMVISKVDPKLLSDVNDSSMPDKGRTKRATGRLSRSLSISNNDATLLAEAIDEAAGMEECTQKLRQSESDSHPDGSVPVLLHDDNLDDADLSTLPEEVEKTDNKEEKKKKKKDRKSRKRDDKRKSFNSTSSKGSSGDEDAKASRRRSRRKDRKGKSGSGSSIEVDGSFSNSGNSFDISASLRDSGTSGNKGPSDGEEREEQLRKSSSMESPDKESRSSRRKNSLRGSDNEGVRRSGARKSSDDLGDLDESNISLRGSGTRPSKSKDGLPRDFGQVKGRHRWA